MGDVKIFNTHVPIIHDDRKKNMYKSRDIDHINGESIESTKEMLITRGGNPKKERKT